MRKDNPNKWEIIVPEGSEPPLTFQRELVQETEDTDTWMEEIS